MVPVLRRDLMFDTIRKRFKEVAPEADFCSLRFVDQRDEMIYVRQNILQPVVTSEDAGAMITVCDKGGMGYGATSDLTTEGLRRAAKQALEWARRTAGKSVVDFKKIRHDPPSGEYESPVKKPWDSIPLGDKIDMLKKQCERLKTDDRIVDWDARLWYTIKDTFLITADGGAVRQKFHMVLPGLRATANEGSETQSRTHGGMRSGRQGGLEILDDLGFHDAPPTVAAQALELLKAPNCPSGKMDLLLSPDQMILQIHESVGHPLELDRILGDERNYAGTSFVTQDMFGKYQYGSKLMNITCDPTVAVGMGAYKFDDDGTPAKKEFLIKDGILVRPLGGATSQARAGMDGVANSRASSWNRPPIDRMVNINLEPGTSTFDEMVAAVEKGVYMESNSSWSIDDSRNKFQFGCEYGRVIENGKLGNVVKKPNYRGISATFWRSLKMVGNEDTFLVLGTPNCGKGEPNQLIRVGHASPTALFESVDVFGGA
ncbi:MAG: TldD/PmbA family protein [Planctomycetota bacterium]|jgi:predicted Zn-dependent protease